jgi:putative sigma-54 modulation protein
MSLTIMARNGRVSEQFKEKVQENVKKFEKYNENVDNIRVVVSKQKKNVEVEIIVTGKNLRIASKAAAENKYDAFNGCEEKIVTALKKEREKIKDRKNTRKIAEMEAEQIKVENDSDEVLYDVLLKSNEIVKPLSVSEAIILMNSKKYVFYAYNDINTGRPSVVYKISENKYGLKEM